MSILLTLGQYIPGSDNYGHHEKNIDPFTAIAVAQQGAKSLAGIAGGIIGSGARKEEQDQAKIAQREAQYNYENFDYGQDVGPIADPYAKLANQSQQYEQDLIARSQADATAVAQDAGTPGAIQAIVTRGVDAAQASAQRVAQLRQAGTAYVDKIRQQRLQQQFGIAETTLGRSDQRLAAANQARQQATQGLIGGIAGAASLGAAGALGAFKDGETPGGGGVGDINVSDFTRVANTGQKTSNQLIQQNPTRFQERPDGSVVDLSQLFNVNSGALNANPYNNISY